MKKQITDHKGITHESIKEMTEFYNIKLNTFYSRKRSGWSIQECIEGRPGYIQGKDGTLYESVLDYSRKNNIPKDACYYRLRKYDSLTNPREVTDHLGNIFINETEMCKYHNIKLSTYKMRKRAGQPIENCLSKERLPYRKRSSKDNSSNRTT